MSSEYFDFGTTDFLQAGQRARAANVNDIFQEIENGLEKLPSEGDIKRGIVNYALDLGSVDEYYVLLPYTTTSYIDGMEVVFTPLSDNTGACTINVDTLGAIPIRRTDGNELSAGDILVGNPTSIRYSNVNECFVLVSTFASFTTELVDAISEVSDLKDDVEDLISSFESLYLGPKAENPTVDNQGNPLTAGVIYFDSTGGVMKVYDGNAWEVAYVPVDGALTEIVEDTTPTLGGNLEMNGFYIVGLKPTQAQLLAYT